MSPDDVSGEPSWGSALTAEYRPSAVPRPAFPQAAGPTADELNTELIPLLRFRCRVLSVIGLAVFAYLAVYSAATNPQVSPLLLALYGLVAGVYALLLVCLRAPASASLTRLRWIELTGLFTYVAFFAWRSRGQLLDLFRIAAAAPPGPVSVQPPMLVAVFHGFNWFALLAAYGVLIPNDWRRSLWVCAGVAAVALAGVVSAWVAAPADIRPAFVPLLADTGRLLAAGTAIAVFGAHNINTLRRRAQDARRVGNYRLIRLLRAGGMGEIYLAEHRWLKRPCAVKLIRPEWVGDPGILQRFEREAQAMTHLTHWNVVEVFDYGRTGDGTFYYVMEYLPGPTLEEMVKQQGPLPPARVVHLLRQVCAALREAHGKGLIHRDIKPGNAIVCERGGICDVVKLLDFGLARPVADEANLTQSGAILGTPAYMSPEQASGAGVPLPQSDVYSLGAVASYLLTGRPPFVRGAAVQVMAAHLTDPVRPPSHLCPGVPADLEAVVLRCLEKGTADRWPSAEALDEALARCACAGEWTQAAAVEWWQSRSDVQPAAPEPARR
jgi:eukaryotic-like serine/threonine-protein kinase